MDLGRAFTFLFDDHEWAGKLAVSAIIAFVSAITTPLLVGLLGWAALLGYQSDLIRNLRDGYPNPAPRWDNFADRITTGGNILAGVFVYMLPNLLLSCCSFAVTSLLGNTFIGFSTPLISLCCLLPISIIYNVVTWPMIALAIARFAEERNIIVFFQFSDLFDTVWRRLDGTFQWIIFTLIVNFVLGLLGAIPCLGWALAPALAIPIHGFLAAGLADRIDTGPKFKRGRPY